MLCVLSSKATSGMLAELTSGSGVPVRLESTGGVDAARDVRAGRYVDVLVLAAEAMRALAADGIVIPDSLAGIATSGIAVVVRDDTAAPDLSDGEAVRRAISAAGRIGYSTGPSGDHLLRLLEGWGIRASLGDWLIQAPPGVPVGRLLADGQVDLAVQQRSELTGIHGIRVVSDLPADVQKRTVFTAGLVRTTTEPAAARDLVAALAALETAAVKGRHGMAPA